MAIRLTAIDNLLKAFGKLDKDSLLQKVFKDSTSLQQDIIALNTEDQLYEKGITSDGVSLGTYSESTINGTKGWEGKKQKNQPYDHVTLKDTGEFYSTFKFKTESGDFIISADTVKPSQDLAETYGNIIGLTQQNKMVVAGWVKAPFVDQMRKAVWK